MLGIFEAGGLLELEVRAGTLFKFIVTIECYCDTMFVGFAPIPMYLQYAAQRIAYLARCGHLCTPLENLHVTGLQ